MKAMFPGSFNPITIGHTEIIKEASNDYEHLYVFVANNESKKYSRTLKFRTDLVKKVVNSLGLKNVTVIQQDPGTLTPNIAKQLGAEVIVRGTRQKSASDEEVALAESYLDINRNLFFNYYYFSSISISSTNVNDALKNNKSIKGMVPYEVEIDILMGSMDKLLDENKKGKMIIFCGPSGSGKGTVAKEFLYEKKYDFHFSISATTRPIRKGEKNGVNYFFLNKKEFETWIFENKFYEWAMFADNYYGTPIAPVLEKINSGHNVFLEIEYQGVEQLIKKAPEAVTIFLAPPSIEELERRLRKRDTESEAMIAKRIETAKYEMELSNNKNLFKYKVINDDVKKAAKEIKDILRRELNV